MADLDEEIKVEGVYGGVQTSTETTEETGPTSWPTTGSSTGSSTESSTESSLPVKRGFWSSMKSFWLQEIDWNAKIDWKREIKVELTPKQQKIENEVNEFLHQEVTWEKFRNFILKPFSFGQSK